jgi:RNA polymerase sigma factor (sigma-70 family)
MPTLPNHGGVLETHLPMLWGAQNYLQALLDDKVPDSLVAATWENFYGLYDDLIRRFVVAQGVPPSDVDDCVQEVWTEVAARLVKFDRPADRPGLRAWLYALVRSKATNAYRKRARQAAASLDELTEGGNEPGNSHGDPAAVYEEEWKKAVLNTVFEQLCEEMSPTNVRLMQFG